MFLARCAIVGTLPLFIGCSGVSSLSRAHRPAADPSRMNEVPREVITQVDLSALDPLDGRLDGASYAATAVVLGLRTIDDACGTYVDMRMFSEVRLGGSEVMNPDDDDDDDVHELRALVLSNIKSACDEPRARVVETNRVAVGDRIVIALGNPMSSLRDGPSWKRKPRVLAYVSSRQTRWSCRVIRCAGKNAIDAALS